MRPLRAEVYGDVASSARFLWASALALLLVMCANLASLLLSAAVGRRAEFALRRALGADDRALRLQSFVEQATLCAMALGIGWVVAGGAMVFLAPRLPGDLMATDSMRLNGRAALYGLGLAAGVSVLLSGLSRTRARRAELAPRLRDGVRISGSGMAPRLRSGLVAGQIAVSLVLVVTTLLLVDTHRRLREVDPGFRTDGVVSLRVALAGEDFEQPGSLRTFVDEVERALGGIAGVNDVGMASRMPFAAAGPGLGASLFVVGESPDLDGEQPLGDVIRVSPGFLQTLGVNLASGRALRAADDHESTRVALVNRMAAQMLWPGREAVGARLRTGTTGDSELLVVGVTEDVRLTDLRRPATPQVYVPASQFPPRSQAYVVSTERPWDSIAAELRGAVASVDRSQPVYDIQPVDLYVDRSLAGPAAAARLLIAFALVSVVLAVLGIYAAVSFGVGVRTSEFGVRRALGARSADIVHMVLREGLGALGLGLLAGAATAVVVAQWISSQLFGVSPLNPRTYLAAIVGLGTVALLAALVPTLRAARADPASVLRDS
ncbi:MAG: FtsX-like permease family protein [Acidobacteria bacterium]|nr:FtsX-like permease family protein [Acidobacteriota bacterium]